VYATLHTKCKKNYEDTLVYSLCRSGFDQIVGLIVSVKKCPNPCRRKNPTESANAVRVYDSLRYDTNTIV